MKTNKYLVLILIITSSISFSQLKIDAEIRPRSEYRHGFKTLIADNENAALFVSQRTRLNTKYSIDKLNFYISLQDVRVWGDVPQLNTSDANGLAIQQAWAEILLDSEFSLKLGRQEVDYDDSRIFGNVAWAQQARSHDMAMLKYKKGQLKFDVGLAFNQSKERLTGTNLETPNTYKAMQYLWLHNNWDNFSGSFLFLNNGLQGANGINYSQTIGTHLKSKFNNLNLTANLYYQMGEDVSNNDLSAYLIGLEAAYKTSDRFTVVFGGELQSGNDYNNTSGTNNAFNPFYGTNHKFNGLMDYFYVGNHINSVGLLDVYLKGSYLLNKKSKLVAALHNFSAAADLNNTVSKQLGTELDLVYSYKFSNEIGLKAGYSQMFASEGMKVLKSNHDDNINNWGWVMVTIKPTLFSSK
ncbi:alginate export family protein [Tenacibaculum xiamenense]|uniref:alginate export family protein n=1 Tax=Tenacibaculum xiamenense TaxID=1261553 RepID=UPI003895B1D3